MKDTKKPIYIKLKELREAHGLSQKDVADYLNLSRQAISQWENGKAYPDIDNIVLLCELYKISSDELLGICSEQTRGTKEESNHSLGEKKNSIVEMLCLSIILLLTSRISFLGIVAPVIILIFMRRFQRNYKMIYILCVVCFVIGVYNTYVLTKYYSIFQYEYLL